MGQIISLHTTIAIVSTQLNGFNTYNYIQNESFVGTHCSGYKYCYLTLFIYLHTV